MCIALKSTRDTRPQQIPNTHMKKLTFLVLVASQFQLVICDSVSLPAWALQVYY